MEESICGGGIVAEIRTRTVRECAGCRAQGRAVGMALVFRLPAFGLIGIELSTPSRLKKCSESLRYTANKTSRLGVLPRELHVTMLRKLAHSCMSDAPVDNLSARICLPQHSNGVPS